MKQPPSGTPGHVSDTGRQRALDEVRHAFEGFGFSQEFWALLRDRPISGRAIEVIGEALHGAYQRGLQCGKQLRAS